MKRSTFKPGSELTFNSVTSVYTSLSNAVTKKKEINICLDLSEVTRCDSAGLALLIELRRLCQHHKKTLEINGVPSQLQSLAEFCGVSRMLVNK